LLSADTVCLILAPSWWRYFTLGKEGKYSTLEVHTDCKKYGGEYERKETYIGGKGANKNA
jgi:hypothetical protein